MLIWIFDWFSQYYHAFQVFHYITLRAVMSTMTALLFCLTLGPWLIEKLTAYQIGQPIRTDGPESHHVKSGTPTMGGVLILAAVGLSALLWGDLKNTYLWIALGLTFAYGMIGWIDDRKKVILRNHKGLSAKSKFFWQTGIAGIAVVLLYTQDPTNHFSQLLIPLIKHCYIPLGFLSIPFACFVIVGTSNAVNLTDGLDGLAIMPTVLVGGALGVFAYVTGNIGFSSYLSVPYIKGIEELTILCGALVGSGLGFLWFNAYPAQIFMGDVGSLALGGALGMIAVLVRQELVLAIMGGIFVLEAVSVMLQVAMFKATGKRIFKMAPIHHHFELKGWAEPKIIVRFWIITVILVLIGLATLKIR